MTVYDSPLLMACILTLPLYLYRPCADVRVPQSSTQLHSLLADLSFDQFVLFAATVRLQNAKSGSSGLLASTTADSAEPLKRGVVVVSDVLKEAEKINDYRRRKVLTTPSDPPVYYITAYLQHDYLPGS